jgi:hypothetical protein
MRKRIEPTKKQQQLRDAEACEDGLRLLARMIVKKRLAEMKLNKAKYKCSDDED